MDNGAGEQQREAVANPEVAPPVTQVPEPVLTMVPARQPISIATKVIWVATILINIAVWVLVSTALQGESGLEYFIVVVLLLASYAPAFIALTVLNVAILTWTIVYLVRRENAFKYHKSTFDVKKA